jgi:hypothetical protein
MKGKGGGKAVATDKFDKKKKADGAVAEQQLQIVENRKGRLSGPFLGPNDNFSKYYDENQIRTECATARAGLMRKSQVP